MKYFRNLLLFCLSIGLATSCSKWVDPNPDVDPRITARKYCNDPQAVNYNWDFPGVPDSTVCYYPADLFEGSYSFKDSIFKSNNSYDTNYAPQTYMLQLTSLGKNKLQLTGFCTNPLFFTAPRIGTMAHGDSTYKIDDTTWAYGQPFCRSQDTLSGTLIREIDSVGKLITIEWKVVSDTGTRLHRGVARKI